MSLKVPSNPDHTNLRKYERKGIECIRRFIDQLLKNPIQRIDYSDFLDSSLIFSSGTQGIPHRVLIALEVQTAGQLNFNNYTNWTVEIDGAHTNCIRLNLTSHYGSGQYIWCSITPSKGIRVSDYFINNNESVPPVLKRSFTF